MKLLFAEVIIGKSFNKHIYIYTYHLAPEKWWLGDDPFLLGPGLFSGAKNKFQGSIPNCGTVVLNGEVHPAVESGSRNPCEAELSKNLRVTAVMKYDQARQMHTSKTNPFKMTVNDHQKEM